MSTFLRFAKDCPQRYKYREDGQWRCNYLGSNGQYYRTGRCAQKNCAAYHMVKQMMPASPPEKKYCNACGYHGHHHWTCDHY